MVSGGADMAGEVPTLQHRNIPPRPTSSRPPWNLGIPQNNPLPPGGARGSIPKFKYI
jgi:hypothetical protein